MELSLSFNKKLDRDWDVVIIGSGPGGLSAALYASRGKLKTLVLEKNFTVGGNIALTSLIEDYPGIKEATGEEFAKLLKEHAESFGAVIATGEEVISVDFNSFPRLIKTRNAEYTAKAVIIATGADPRRLNVPGEEEFIGKGVSYCAVCDAPFFKDKNVIVVGGGNSALDEGLYLTKFARRVYIVHRRDQLRADKILQERAFANPKIEFIFNTVVKKIEGDSVVRRVLLFNNKTNEEKYFDIDAVFIYIGLVPNSSLFNVEKDERGYIITNERMETSVRGVYAVGDVRKSPLKQAITAAGEGAIAGYFAEKFVEGLG